MNYLKQKIRIHSFQKLILWLLVVPIVGGFAFLKHFDLDLVRFLTSPPQSVNISTLDQPKTQEALRLYLYDYQPDLMTFLEKGKDNIRYYQATLSGHNILVKTDKNYDEYELMNFSAVLHVMNPDYMHYFLLDDADEELLAKHSSDVVPNILLIEDSIDRTHGFTVFFLVINGLIFLLILHALWLTLFPYHLKEFKQLKIAYGLTPKMIEESIAKDLQNGHLINKKQTIISNHFCVVQTLRYTRIIALDELLELRMKNSLDMLAYWWWLPRIFLYVQEERRNYRVRMSKKMIFVLFQRISEGLSSVKLPKDFVKIKPQPTLSPMEKVLQNMNQEIFINSTASYSAKDNQTTLSDWVPLLRFILNSFLFLLAIFVLSLGTALISPIIFLFAYIIGAIILTIIRIIQVFKVTKTFGGALSIIVFIVSIFMLLYMPKLVFNLGKLLMDMFVGS